MNRIYRSIWNEKTGTFVAASEISSSGGRKSSPGATAVAGNSRFALKGLALSLMLAFGSNIHALPTGGAVSAGSATIASGAGTTTINQSSQNVAINWQGFNIGAGEAVRFVQPNSSSAALNRVLGSDPSSILGSLSANGKVFLVNPNGILFGQGAQVNVGGLVASTRNITDGDFMAGNYKFAGSGGGTIVNQGTITADGGYVVLLGANVSNEGVISARLGTVALAAGNAFTLDVAGDGLLNVMVNEGAVNALVQNGGLIKADGGYVLLTAMSAGNLLQSAVNNTGIIQAQTVGNRNGTIMLMGDMQSGTVNVGGTLDASAPNGGNGGFIETSAARVQFANNAIITTAAPFGVTGSFLIDPEDFIVGPIATGGNIAGTTLEGLLVNNNVIISTNTAADTSVVGTPFTRNANIIRGVATPLTGDIIVNDALTWDGVGGTGGSTTLTLNAFRNVILNGAISPTHGNLVVCCGNNITVNGAIVTALGGSVFLSAGNDITVNTRITNNNGNVTLCAGHDVILNSGITMTRTALVLANESLSVLGVQDGLVLSAGNAATGPGAAGGTVRILGAPADRITVTGFAPSPLPVTISYNPTSYAVGAETNYSGAGTFDAFTRAVLTQFMLVHPGGADKVFDNTTTAIFTGLQGSPAGATLNAGGIANFANVGPNPNIPITYSGLSLAPSAIVTGGTGRNFALPTPCCGVVTRTIGTILPAVAVLPPVVPPVVPPLAVLTPPFSPQPVIAAPESPQFEFAPTMLQFVPGLNLTVTGITMPPIVLAETPPPVPAPVVVPPVVPPQIFIPPQLPPRRDRN